MATKNMKAAVLSPFKVNLFFLKSLPMAFIAGLRVKKMTDTECRVTIPYKYWTKNPFKSMYFAAQSMGAELSTALLATNAIQGSGRKISMLVLDMKANFSKKATSRITFTCTDGEKIAEVIKECEKTGKGHTVVAKTIGMDEAGDQVSEFEFEWTFKIK